MDQLINIKSLLRKYLIYFLSLYFHKQMKILIIIAKELKFPYFPPNKIFRMKAQL